MFCIDWIFVIVLVILIVLPFLSVYPAFDRFPYELLFSALGAASIVGLGWERIADSRRKRLYRLMKRVYLDEGELKLHRTLESICQEVRGWNTVGEDTKAIIQRAGSILRQLGNFTRIDRLYPKEVREELETLYRWVGEYVEDRKDFVNRVEEFRRRHQNTYDNLLWGIAKDEMELRKEGLDLVPYFKRSGTKADGYDALPGYLEEAMVDFTKRLVQESRYVRRMNEGTWKTEILERASQVRDSFVKFLAEHGIEPPRDFDRDWVRGGGVRVLSG